VNDLKAILPRLRNEHIVLTHLSRRTALWQAGKIVESVVGPSEAQRIAFLMDRRRERVPARREAADGVDPGPDAR
jgi:hypothetical protein